MLKQYIKEEEVKDLIEDHVKVKEKVFKTVKSIQQDL